MDKHEVRHKLEREVSSVLGITLYLIVFFGAFATYQNLLLREFKISELTLTYGVVLVKSLVLAKIIRIGEYAHVGSRYEGGPLIFSTLHKSFVFGLFIVAFTLTEEVTKGLLHKEDVTEVLQRFLTSPRREEALARLVVMLCALIPFFALREIGRILGEGKLFELFFRRHRIIESDLQRRIQGA